jgi:hypothetical protein
VLQAEPKEGTVFQNLGLEAGSSFDWSFEYLDFELRNRSQSMHWAITAMFFKNGPKMMSRIKTVDQFKIHIYPEPPYQKLGNCGPSPRHPFLIVFKS